MERKTLRILLGFSMAVGIASADTFKVSISDQLKGTSGFLAFDFLAGSPIPDNTITVTNFSINGILLGSSTSGSVSGALVPGPLTLSDNSFFNEWLQQLTYGSTISFQFTTSGNFVSGGIPDNFSFYLLNSSRDPYPTSDTLADSLFSIDLDGAGSIPIIYTSTYAQADVVAETAEIPEPSLAPAAVGLLVWLVGASRSRVQSLGDPRDKPRD